MVTVWIHGFGAGAMGWEVVERKAMRKYQPIQQGDTVAACYQHDDECYTGTAIRVMPNADIQIYYDDGVFDYRVPAFYYSVQR
jgi:hypothetical protein